MKKFHCFESDRAATEDGRLREARSGRISANDSNSETEVVRGTYERRNARNSKEERNARERKMKGGEKDGAVAGCGEQKTGVAG